MQGQQTPAGMRSGTPPVSKHNKLSLTPPKLLLAVLLAVAAAVLFRNFFPVSGSSQNLDLATTNKQSTSILVETITTTVTQTLPVSTRESVQESTMSASEQT